MISWKRPFSLEKSEDRLLSISLQVKAWRKANHKMKWQIAADEFRRLPPLPSLTDADRKDGFIGVVLCYGFGDDGAGSADSVQSGRVAWEYARRLRRGKAWQCQYIDFSKPDYFRLRPGAPPRPKGFYFCKLNLGTAFYKSAVSGFLKTLAQDTGCGPEGIQFLTITHPHFADYMNTRKIPFMAFADYDVAPYGFNDFFDALQMFCSNGVLGLGIGNVDRNYPGFGIPSLRF